MNKLTILTAIIFILFTFGCNEKQESLEQNEFILNGELEGIGDESWIYLKLDNETVDSAMVLNNRFSLNGSVEHPKTFDLYVKDSRNFARVWLEPGEIIFKAKNGAFREATIEGSTSHMESEQLWEPIWKYRKHRDSVRKILQNDELSDSLRYEARKEQKLIEKNWGRIEKEFIENNPNSYVSAATLDFYSKSFSKDFVSTNYDYFSEELKNSSYGESIKRFLELNRNPKVGDRYVDFSMPNQNGSITNFSDFEGKLLLLDFWASWCTPCKKEYPALRKAYSKFQAEGFEIVSISEDQSKDDWLRAIKDNDLTWVNLWSDKGSQGDPYLIYRIKGIPDNFLINDKGIIVGRNLRGEELIAKIEEELNNETKA